MADLNDDLNFGISLEPNDAVVQQISNKPNKSPQSKPFHPQ
jgi:hypothetical protein